MGTATEPRMSAEVAEEAGAEMIARRPRMTPVGIWLMGHTERG